jgi:hypothetical protein
MRRAAPFTRWRAVALSMLLAIGAVSASAADPVYSEEAVKAVYLLRFSHYVEWPQGSADNPPFVFAVLEAPGVARELRRILPANPIRGQTALVKEVTRIQDAEGARILFIGSGHSQSLHATAGATGPMLVVTEDPQGLDAGSTLNFVLVDQRVRFEVSLTAAERAGIKVSSDLLSVAIRVRGGQRQSDFYCLPLWSPEETDQQCGMRQADEATTRAISQRRSGRAESSRGMPAFVRMRISRLNVDG